MIDRRALTALRHIEYRRIFVASLIVQTGWWLSHISFQALMVELTDNDELQVSLLFFALFIPVLLVAPVGGLVADRLDRKMIMLWCYAGMFTGAVTMTALVATDTITPNLLLLVGLLLGFVFAVLGPALQATVANSVTAVDLPSAISLQATSINLTRVVGPLVAAPLVAAGLFEAAYAAYAVAAVVAMVLVSRVRLTPYRRDPDQLSPIARLAEGVHHARERQPAVPVLALTAVLTLLAVSHIGLLPSFVTEDLGQPEGRFSIVVAATGVGAIVGALSVGSLRSAPTMRRAGWLGALYAVTLTAFALTESFVIAVLIQALAGIFYFAAFTTLQTIIQRVVDDAKRGRVMSLFQISWAGLVPFGTLALGFTASRPGVGIRTTLVISTLIAGAVSAGVALVGGRWPAADAYETSEGSALGGPEPGVEVGDDVVDALEAN
ncbi:MAG: MFS transporter [Acidimicrobiia bacterium]|nr:MFS transporter [Acidimicrobiia bacterium]